MIFSFTGAQSTGKTTLLKELVEKNGSYPFEFVPEVTRLVMRDYGVAINEGGDDMTQMLIMTEHIRNLYRNKTDRFIRGLRAWVGFKQIGIEYKRIDRKIGLSKYNIFKCCLQFASLFQYILNTS